MAVRSDVETKCWKTRMTRAMSAGVLAALALGAYTSTARAQAPSDVTPGPERMLVPHRVEIQHGLSPFIAPTQSSIPGPFQPRGGTTLYSRTVGVGTIGYTFGGTPAGSGTQVDSYFDDIHIPIASLQVAGQTVSRLSICQIQLAARMAANAPANSMNVYWTTFDETNNTSGITFPPTFITNVAVPANAAGANATLALTIGDGVNPIPGLEAVPLDMGFVTIGGQPVVFGSFAIGQSIGTLNASVVGYRLCTATDANTNSQSFNLFWQYDSDTGPSGPGPYGFAAPTNGSFYYVIKGTPVAPTTPITCCVPGTTSAVCFIAADADNCTKSGGNSIAGQTTCTASSCTILNCCNVTTGVCTTVSGAATCPGAQVSNATACATNPCTQPAAPANDDCVGALPGSNFELTIPGHPIRTNQSNVGWTTSLGYDTAPGISTCTFAQKDEWYLFTATAAQATQQFQVTVTPNASAGDFTAQPLSLAVYDGGPGCPGGPGGELVCADFSNPNQVIFTGTGSVSYFIRVAYGGANTAGTSQFSIAIAQVGTGACCNDINGLCVLSSALGVCNTQAGYTNFQGTGSTCTSSPCARGSCCLPSGTSCSLTGSAGCAGGNWVQNGACQPNPCGGPCCNPTTGVCNITTPAACTGPSTFAGPGLTCAACPAPANDQCTSAVALALGVGTTGIMTGATGVDLTNCSGTTSDVWYSFTPAATSNYTITTVPANANTPGQAIAVFAPPCDPAVDSNLFCAGAVGLGVTNTINVSLATGTTYLIRVGSFTGDSGSFTITITQPAGLGACCGIGAACFVVNVATDCAAPGVYRGVGSTCVAPATQCVAGSCCFPGSGQCNVTIQSFCTGVGGVWNAGDTTCGTTNCLAAVPANDACTSATTITSPTFTSNVGSDAASNEGVPAGQCNAAASQTIGANNSIWYTFTAPAAGVLNIQLNNWGTYDMIMSVFTGTCGALTEIGCFDEPEPFNVNANLGAGTTIKIMVAQFDVTAGGGWNSLTTSFALSGQCCISGACTVTTQAACTGTWTSGGTCTVNTCPVASGVCCRGSTCATGFADAAACAAAVNTVAPLTVLSKFVPATTACNTPVTTPGTLGNTISPCCYANYNHNATLEVQDIFDFLNDWFAGKKAAIVGGDGTAGTLQVQNIFDFLNSWFAGGCT